MAQGVGSNLLKSDPPRTSTSPPWWDLIYIFCQFVPFCLVLTSVTVWCVVCGHCRRGTCVPFAVYRWVFFSEDPICRLSTPPHGVTGRPCGSVPNSTPDAAATAFREQLTRQGVQKSHFWPARECSAASPRTGARLGAWTPTLRSPATTTARTRRTRSPRPLLPSTRPPRRGSRSTSRSLTACRRRPRPRRPRRPRRRPRRT